MNIPCPSCGEQLNVGTEKHAVVAACMNGGTLKSGGRAIWTGPLDHWGSAGTRFDFGDARDPSHIIQTAPRDMDTRKRAA